MRSSPKRKMTKVVTANSAIAGSDCRVRSSTRRSLARIAAKARAGARVMRAPVARPGVAGRARRRALVGDPPPCERQARSASASPLGVVGDDDAGAARAGADQRLEPARAASASRWESGSSSSSSSGSCRTQRQIAEPLRASRPRARRPARRRAAPSRRASSSSLDPRLGGLAVEPVQARVEAQVLAAAEVAVEQRLVAEVADPAAQLPGLAGQRAAEHRDLAAARAQQGREDPQQRRLAGAVRAEHGQRLARRRARGRRPRAPVRSP